MKSIKMFVAVAAALTGLSGCIASTGPNDTGPDGGGGQGGSGSGGSAASGGHGGEGQGGSAGGLPAYHSPESTGVPCAYDVDCAQVGHALCEIVTCNEGQCVRAMAPFGRQCGTDGSDICDGRGACGQWMPYGIVQCYSGAPLPYSECPTCDDADPVTKDACENIGGLMQCTHTQLPEGHYCGPWYTIQNGQCCPNVPTAKAQSSND